MEPNSPKKIQFDVPPFQSQLDPQAAEHIRRRRPTPATLVIYHESSSGAADEMRTTSSSMSDLKEIDVSPAQRKQSTFIPPSMKGKITKSQKASSLPEEEEVTNTQH
ncbi:protein phosphatase 1 regulatory subunit 1C isoform X2 [Esox lucius]|uniref:protein phosphatase 1 regulatory subunit 1C isoform X2 n=1 Tax=Esox lucius TaxID=8010 RepID=UPI0014768C01|nr:protein phosphatase 1 regulatory subunit 1C isoform X2 [Esox lucius]